MNAWLKTVRVATWLIGLLQLVFFDPLFMRGSAHSGEAVMVTALLGAACIASTLLAAALITWSKRPHVVVPAMAVSVIGVVFCLGIVLDIVVENSAASRRGVGHREERARNEQVRYPLLQALRKGSTVAALAALDAHPDEVSRSGDSLFREAMCVPMSDASFAVLNRLRPIANDDGTWLQSASLCSPEAVRAAARRGASLVRAGTLLHESNDPELISWLVEHDVPVDIRDGGYTPLMRFRSPAIIRTLLQHGADPNTRDPNGGMALYWAIDRCSDYSPSDCIAELLRAGTNPLTPNRDDHTASYYSARRQPDGNPHPTLVAAEHAWRCAALVPDGSPALPGCTTPPVSQTSLLERLLDPALFDADLRAAQELLVPLGPFYELTPLPTVRQFRRITEDYTFFIDFEPAQQPELSHPRLVRLRLAAPLDEVLAAIRPATVGELGTSTEHEVPIYRLPNARSIEVYDDDGEPGIVAELRRVAEPEKPAKARRPR
jgi:hypothetical protein